MWSIKKPLAKELLNLSDEEFATKVNHAFVSIQFDLNYFLDMNKSKKLKKKVHEEYKNELASAIEDKLQNVMDFLKDCN